MLIQLSSSPVPQIPGKVHDTGDVVTLTQCHVPCLGSHDVTLTLRHFLRDANEEDLKTTVAEVGGAIGARTNWRQKVEVGKVQSPVQNNCPRAFRDCQEKNSSRWSPGAEPETHDRAYFALLKNVAALQEENKCLRDQLDSVQIDVDLYVEVAREVEEHYSAQKASNHELQDRIQRVEATSMQARAKLASAEETIKMLQANECVQVRAANECIQARADNAYNSLHVVPLTTGEGFASHNMQQEAVQYRRAVREQLRSAAAACKISALSVRALERVLCTPWQMLDGEVLSEDDEEEEVCRARRSRWGRFHIAWSHEA
jgi:hypothetical protein